MHARRPAMSLTASGRPVGRTAGLLLFLFIGGCQRPLHSDQAEAIHQSLVESVRREIASLPEEAEPVRTVQPPERTTDAIERRREELEAMAGPGSYRDEQPGAYLDLAGTPQQEVAISLQQAIQTGVRNNLAAQIARLQPGISEAQLAAAEAAFDALFFTDLSYTKLDEPNTVPVLRGVPLGAQVTVQNTTTFETGIRKPLVSGGEVTVSTILDRSRNNTPGFELTPDPAYLSRISLGISQPLLRGFGSDVNLAEIRLAQNQDRRSIQELRDTLLELVQSIESAYWDLVVARRRLLIQERLVERGISVRDRIEARLIRDALPAEYADAVATVERRRAEVISARRDHRAASDRLKALINDPTLTVGSEVQLKPIDFMPEAPLEYDLREAIVTAVDSRPEIYSALIDLDDRAIGVTLADNARLPLLNVSARMEYLGLADDARSSVGNVFEDQFVDYFIALTFEQPIGNRAAEANYRAARLRQSAAVIAYRQAVQNVVLDVKAALRDVRANYALIAASRTSRLAAAENLRAFDAADLMQALTPERLNLRFQRQSALASAELTEINALADFNKAVARLYRAMGVGLEMNNIEFVASGDGS